MLTDSSFSQRSDSDLELTTSQRRTAEYIINVLKPMITLTELSGTIPMLMNIKKQQLAVHEDDRAVTKTLKTTLSILTDDGSSKTVSWRAVVIVQLLFLTHISRTFCNCKNKFMSMSLINAFVATRLDYCNALSGSSIARLQMVENAAPHLLTGTRKHKLISPILASLHWLPVHHRFHFKQCLPYVNKTMAACK